MTSASNTRERWTIDPGNTALLVVDVQQRELSPEIAAAYPGYQRAIIERALPNQQRVLAAARTAGCEVVYSVIESLTRDGRDRSLDHKLSNILVPRGSPDARAIEAVAPHDDDIVLSVRRQNNLDSERLSLRDGFQFQSRPLSRPGTPSSFVASFFA